MLKFLIWRKQKIQRTAKGSKINTKLSIYYGHVWNSLVTIIISLAIKFFGADVNCWHLQRRFSTNLGIDLKSPSANTYKLHMITYININKNNSMNNRNYMSSIMSFTSVIISASCLTVTSLFGLPTLKI